MTKQFYDDVAGQYHLILKTGIAGGFWILPANHCCRGTMAAVGAARLRASL
jgi:hypothetical protein